MKFNKNAQTGLEQVFYVIAYMMFAGLLFFVIYYVWGQVSPAINGALLNSTNYTDPYNTYQDSFNITKQSEQTTGGIGLFNSMSILILLGLIIMTLVSAFFIQSHPVFFFISLIVLGVAVMLAVVYSNVYQTITEDTNFGSTASSFPVTNLLMQYLPFLIAIIVIALLIILSWRGSTGGGGL